MHKFTLMQHSETALFEKEFCWNNGHSMKIMWNDGKYFLESLICHSILVFNQQIFGQLHQTKFVLLLH